METFKERMKRIRKRAGFKSQADAAHAIGCERGTVSMWEAPSSPVESVSEDYIFRVAHAYRVDPMWINTGKGHDGFVESAGEVRTYHPEDAPNEGDILIKESRVSFSGGPGSTPTFELLDESEPATYRQSWFEKEQMNPNRCRRFRVVGRSQEPFLFSGDTILVNMDETTVRNDQTYAIRYEDDLRVKKLRKALNGDLILISWNDREYPQEIVPAAVAEEHITIIGRVRDKSGRGGL